MAVEADTRFIINNNLINKGWILDIKKPNRNVFFESGIFDIINNPKFRKTRKRPDYVLIDSNKEPIGVIEAKAGGKDLNKALIQAVDYAEMLNAPLIFAMNNSYCQTRHLYKNKPLYINENEVNELIKHEEALKFITEKTNEIYTVPKEIIISRQELIHVFKALSNTLRSEGLRAGIERLSEFANILFLKLYTENNRESKLWDSIKKVNNEVLIDVVNQTFKHIEKKYGASVFTELQIKKPNTLREIINSLDRLTLSLINTDIKGDAFEYFLQQATATNNDLGEYFTPRHIIKTIISLVRPKFKETIYDPFCGTGGFLTGAFNYIKENNIIKTKDEKEILGKKTIFGNEITTNSRLAKMNMILHGDGHSGIKQLDSLENPVEYKYDVVVTNIPFSQKITKTIIGDDKKTTNPISPLYYNNLAKNSGDGVCLLHCFKAVKRGGRLAIIVPEGVLFRKTLKEVRKHLLNNAVLRTVISLPQGVFLPYTNAKTYILYFTDCHKKKTKDKFWYFETKNDGFTLDSYRKKIESNDLKKINYVNFKKEQCNISDIGFDIIKLQSIEDNDYNLIGRIYKTFSQKHKFEMVPLGKICEEIKKYAGINWEKYPVCTIASLKGGLVYQANYFKKEIASKNRIKYKIIAPNHFGYRPPGLDIATIGYNKFPESVIVSPIYVVFSCDQEKVNNEFLLKIFQSEDFKDIVKPLMIGTARPSVSYKEFSKIKIPLPPIELQNYFEEKEKLIEQRKIEIKNIGKDMNNTIYSIWNGGTEND